MRELIAFVAGITCGMSFCNIIYIIKKRREEHKNDHR